MSRHYCKMCFCVWDCDFSDCIESVDSNCPKCKVKIAQAVIMPEILEGLKSVYPKELLDTGNLKN